MKYTNATFRFLLPLLAVAWAAPLQAQTPTYASATTSMNVYNAAPATADKPDDQGGMITIRARVNEVNVLFIATDKHGKFVRDLGQNDFKILDDHKPPRN